MDIRGTDFVCYQTSDIDRAVAFYRDTLGLELLGHYEEIKWAEFKAGNVTLAINDPSAFDASMAAKVGGACVAFAVEDVEAAMAELQGKGVPVVFAVQESPVCHFACVADPDGNQVWLHCRKDGTFAD